MVTSHTSKAFSLAPLINYLNNKKKLRNFYIFINLEIIDYKNKYILSPKKLMVGMLRYPLEQSFALLTPKLMDLFNC